MAIVFSICAVLSLLALVRAPSDVERTERLAFGILLAATLLSPTLACIDELRTLTLPTVSVSPSDPLYEQVMEQAFVDGVAEAICREFSVSAACVQVRVRDFDASAMRGHMTILLRAEAARLDHKAVERYIEEGGLGTCDVTRELG